MIASGASRSFAAAVIQTARSFNARGPWHRETRRATNTTPITLERYGIELLRRCSRAPLARTSDLRDGGCVSLAVPRRPVASTSRSRCRMGGSPAQHPLAPPLRLGISFHEAA
jgi:hypothetical protein